MSDRYAHTQRRLPRLVSSHSGGFAKCASLSRIIKFVGRRRDTTVIVIVD